MSHANCIGRPLIFVTNGLGGLLAKDAVAGSLKQHQDPLWSDLKRSCKGFVTFSTPHSEAKVSTWGEKLSDTMGSLLGVITRSLLGGIATYRGGLYGQ
jgi:hypothetical protein